jgi:thioredoxin-like negative regulator of GroEL
MRNLNENQYDEAIKAPGSVLIHFWASWNKRDDTLSTTLSDMEHTGKFADIDVFKYCVDVPEAQSRCRNMGILSLPFLAYYEDGKLVRTRIGNSDASIISEFIGARIRKIADS